MRSDLWQALDQVHAWVRFADAKAGAILAVSGVLVGALLQTSRPGSTDIACAWAGGLALASGLLAVVAGVLSLLCLKPRLRTGKARSLLYFNHVARRFDERSSYVDALTRLLENETDLDAEVAGQMLGVSRVARRKFLLTGWAVIALLLAVLTAVALGFYVTVLGGCSL